jgi:lambda family phage portal protein
MLHVNVIGPKGFGHSARVRNNDGKLNEKVNDRIEDKFCEWSRRVNLEGNRSLNSFQRAGLKQAARDGEFLVRYWRGPDFPCGLALEAIDPDLLDDNLNADLGEGSFIRMGIEMDSKRRPVAYHIWNRPEAANGSPTPRERMRIPASDILHVYDPDRVNQARGLTWFMAAMVPLRHLNAYIESELVAARISASKMGFFSRKLEAMGAVGSGLKGSQEFTMEADPGTFGILPDGYELNTFDPNHPNSAFGDFVKAAMRDIGTALGVSYNALGNDLEGVNYSSMRSGLLIERDNWRTMQDWWTSSFLLPLYSEWMRMAVVSGELKLDTRDFRKFLDVKFAARGWPWVDPLKDMQAAVLAIQNGMGSRTATMAEVGEDFEETLELLAEENQLAKDMSVTITAPEPTKGAAPPSDSEDAADGADAEDSADPPSRNGSHEMSMDRPARRF